MILRDLRWNNILFRFTKTVWHFIKMNRVIILSNIHHEWLNVIHIVGRSNYIIHRIVWTLFKTLFWYLGFFLYLIICTLIFDFIRFNYIFIFLSINILLFIDNLNWDFAIFWNATQSIFFLIHSERLPVTHFIFTFFLDLEGMHATLQINFIQTFQKDFLWLKLFLVPDFVFEFVY